MGALLGGWDRSWRGWGGVWPWCGASRCHMGMESSAGELYYFIALEPQGGEVEGYCITNDEHMIEKTMPLTSNPAKVC